ncbi:WD40 repeat-like protein [Xylaria sp. FL0933]|nr:WD40 repeat-like protein [Xylaria sp. FL0933]
MATYGHISKAPITKSTDVVDLTIDADNNTHTVAETRSNSYNHPHRQLARLPAPAASPSHTPNSANGASSSRDDSIAGDTRPAKRQRTGEPTGEPPGPDASPQERRRYELAAVLAGCLESQIYPHIERATEQLDPAVYDLEKLGLKVTKLLVTKDFQKWFYEGNGRLDRSIESQIAAGIPRLVTQLAAGPDCRWPTQSATPTHSTATATTTTTTTTTTTITATTTALSSASTTASAPPPPCPPPNLIAPVTVPVILPSIEKESNISNYTHDDADSSDGGGDDDDRGYGSIPGPDLDMSDDLLPDESEEPEPDFQSTSRTPQELYDLAPSQPQPRGFGLPLRPYLSALERQQIMSSVAKAFPRLILKRPLGSQVFHVDFNNAEIQYLQQLARILYGKPAVHNERSTLRDLRNVLKKVPSMRTSLAEIHTKGYVGYDSPPPSLTRRSPDDITNFLNDLYGKKLNSGPKYLFIEENNSMAQSETSRANKIPALLLEREVYGNRLGAGCWYRNFVVTAKSHREDYLEPQVEWVDCAGDIMTVSWLSNTDFICGTTTHSDSHNQQYNKPGNLLLGSTVTDTLRAYPDHRIIRPVVSSGDNALESMVASQDPWLFTSVVSSDYDPCWDLAFTSSFDKTVKVWKAENGSIVVQGTWNHEGRVNFVVASKNGTGTIATAADVPTEAVRVYHPDHSNISDSPYDSYSCTRVHDEDYVPSEKWAYYPAAIRWGLAANVNHLLLIGYSPRSPTGEDHLIPEDKRKSGELCLWDTRKKTQVKVNSAKTQNVFEVAWHPSRAAFAAATSASQALEKTDQTPRTQIRLFEVNKENQYSAIKTLDCAAVDINELAIIPNSVLYSYVAAGCTNGKVYVWDTSASDWPMCVLEHGDPIEELLGSREEEDVGVKFVAWATTADRLYTGSSDGVLKVWNIRHGKGVLVKDLIEAKAPITYGAFSPDFTKLVIGDGSGRVYLLALDTKDEDPSSSDPTQDSTNFLTVRTESGSQLTVRRPIPFIPHPEVPPPDKLTESQESAGIQPDPTVGDLQGVNYSSTGLFREEELLNEDLNEPFSAIFRNKQQVSELGHSQIRLPRQPELSVNSLMNGWHGNLYHPPEQENPFNGNDSSEEISASDYRDVFDHATLLELEKEKAELDNRLYELSYESSIASGEDDDNPM